MSRRLSVATAGKTARSIYLVFKINAMLAYGYFVNSCSESAHLQQRPRRKGKLRMPTERPDPKKPSQDIKRTRRFHARHPPQGHLN
jgi:hypothetical protein